VTEFWPARVESQDAERAVVPEMRAA
jgi:hypothetical protein